MRSNFGEVAQNFKLKRVGGAPKGHQLKPLSINSRCLHPSVVFPFYTTEINKTIMLFQKIIATWAPTKLKSRIALGVQIGDP